MAHSRWNFYLAESSSMELIADISEESRDKNFQLTLNQPGTFSWTMPFQTEWKDYLNPVEHCLIAKKNKEYVWSGPIWTKQESFTEGTIALSASGWFIMLMQRFLTDSDQTYTNENEGDIVFDLLSIANAQEIDSIARPTWLTAGVNTTIHNRTHTFNRWQNIGQEIISLTNIEASFDIYINPQTRELNVRESTDYLDNTEAIFGFNWGPRNVGNVSREVNADDMNNQYYIVGQFGTAEAHETSSVDTYNLHQEVINLNEVSDINLLAAIANAEVAVNKNPRVNINFDPMPEGSIEHIPHFFEDYNLGDKIYLTAKRDGMEILNQAIRVFGINLNIDNEGNERISSLQTTFQSG